MKSIMETELHAYIDGVLPEGARAEVEANRDMRVMAGRLEASLRKALLEKRHQAE